MAGRFSDDIPFLFQGEIVYANFGSEKDFDYLQKNGIDLKNSIALIRYGQISRAKKVSTLNLLFSIDPNQCSSLDSQQSSQLRSAATTIWPMAHNTLIFCS